MKLCHCREDQCINTSWTYHIDPDFDPIMIEGQGEVLNAFTVYQAESVRDLRICICVIVFRCLKLCSYCYSICPLTAENLGVFLDGEWIKCPSCLIVAKFHPNPGFLRIMLFGQSVLAGSVLSYTNILVLQMLP